MVETTLILRTDPVIYFSLRNSKRTLDYLSPQKAIAKILLRFHQFKL